MRCPTRRATMSVVPPAGNGTTTRIGLEGKDWAKAGCATAVEPTRERINAAASFIRFSDVLGVDRTSLAYQTVDAVIEQLRTRDEEQGVDQTVEPAHVDAPLQPHAGVDAGDARRDQERGRNEDARIEKPQPQVGQDLGVVEREEEDERGGDEGFLVELLRQEVHHHRRAAGVGDEAGEARYRAPEPAGERAGFAEKIPLGVKRPSEKPNCDRAEEDADPVIAHEAGRQRADEDAGQARGHDDAYDAPVPAPEIRAHT